MTRLLVPPSRSQPPTAVNPTLQDIRDMAANSWLGLPNTNPSNMTPSPVPPGDGPDRVIRSFSGGTLIPGTPDYFIIWGGGHTGYAGNEVYGFSLTDFAWSLIEPGTPVAQIPPNNAANVETYPDGKPAARHTYAAITHDTLGNFMSFPVTSVWGDGQSGDGRVRRLNLPAGTWSDLDNTYAGGGNSIGATGAVHPVTGEFWYIQNNGGAEFSRFIIGSGWTHYLGGLPTSSTTGMMMAVDPTQEIAIMTGNNGPFAWDLTAQPEAHTVPVVTGPTSLVSGNDGTANVFRSVDGKCYCWAGGTTIHKYTPGIAAITVDAITGTTGDTPPTGEVNGTYGRFNYWAAEDVFIGIQDYNGNVYVYKP